MLAELVVTAEGGLVFKRSGIFVTIERYCCEPNADFPLFHYGCDEEIDSMERRLMREIMSRRNFSPVDPRYIHVAIVVDTAWFFAKYGMGN